LKSFEELSFSGSKLHIIFEIAKKNYKKNAFYLLFWTFFQLFWFNSVQQAVIATIVTRRVKNWAQEASYWKLFSTFATR